MLAEAVMVWLLVPAGLVLPHDLQGTKFISRKCFVVDGADVKSLQGRCREFDTSKTAKEAEDRCHAQIKPLVEACAPH